MNQETHDTKDWRQTLRQALVKAEQDLTQCQQRIGQGMAARKTLQRNAFQRRGAKKTIRTQCKELARVQTYLQYYQSRRRGLRTLVKFYRGMNRAE